MKLFRRAGALSALLLGTALVLPSPAGAESAAYLYRLADFSGVVPYDDVKLVADRRQDEVYAAVGNSVRVFNGSGMEVYRFDVDSRSGTLFDLAAEESGDLLLLTLVLDPSRSGPSWSVLRSDYRGEPKEKMAFTGFPPELASFRPNVIFLRDESIVLASLTEWRVVTTDRAGAFRKTYDLIALSGLQPKDREKNDLLGFYVDRQGNMLFTVPTLFKVFVVSPEGSVRSFGRPGSSPGAFGVVAGIVADDHGNIIVADKGRGIVMIFDGKLELSAEFGRGEGLASLVRPTALALGPSGKLYVTQARQRGVSVFKLSEGQEAGAPQP
jgi:hypothetical protein